MRRDSNINMAWLVAFESAARTLSFTKTAEELGLSQGAVSIQIRNLEKALGASLFERRGRHIVLTDEGLAYFPEVNDALSALFDTTSRLFTGSRRNVVAISCFSPTFADHWIAPHLATVMDRFPDVQFDITVDYQSAKTRSARDDLIFAVAGGTQHSVIPLVEERLVAVCAPGYLARYGPDWRQGTLIESIGSRETWDDWQTHTGSKGRATGRQIRVNSMSAALKLAECGTGTALIADAFIKDHLKTGRLVEVSKGLSLPGRTHGVVAETLTRLRPVARGVITQLFEAADNPLPQDLMPRQS